MLGINFIKLETGTLVNINHIIAVDELETGEALIVTANSMYSYEDSRGKEVIEDLILQCYGMNTKQNIKNTGTADDYRYLNL